MFLKDLMIIEENKIYLPNDKRDEIKQIFSEIQNLFPKNLTLNLYFSIYSRSFDIDIYNEHKIPIKNKTYAELNDKGSIRIDMWMPDKSICAIYITSFNNLKNFHSNIKINFKDILGRTVSKNDILLVTRKENYPNVSNFLSNFWFKNENTITFICDKSITIDSVIDTEKRVLIMDKLQQTMFRLQN